MNLWDRIVERVFGSQIARRVDLAVRALDDARDRLYSSSESARDRRSADRAEVLRDSVEAWRVNPLARRIVELTTQFVVGDGVTVASEHKRTHAFLQEWFDHRLNRMTVRVSEWCDELTRSGEIFVALTTDSSGMSFVRAIPASEIDDIQTASNDVEQELAYTQKPSTLGDDPISWNAYDELSDARGADGVFPAVMLHYAINRPVGGKRGESDLAPLLRWLTRYSAWLEDRVRLNRFRQTFLFWVKGMFANLAERKSREAELNANPPSPGTVLVTDTTEEWDVLSPKLESADAEKDGLAIKKMIAAGSGNPLHFLAEPESSTRTTAEQAGGPTYRHYAARQTFFLWLLRDVARVVVRRRAMVDRMVKRDAVITASGTDISARDNTALAVAVSTVSNAFLGLYDRGFVDDAELLRIAYKFCGEAADVAKILADGKRAFDGRGGISPTPQGVGIKPPNKAIGAIGIDPQTGDIVAKGG